MEVVETRVKTAQSLLDFEDKLILLVPLFRSLNLIYRGLLEKEKLGSLEREDLYAFLEVLDIFKRELEKIEEDFAVEVEKVENKFAEVLSKF